MAGDPSKRPWMAFKSRDYPIPDELARELAALVIEWSGFESAIVLDIEGIARGAVIPKSFKKKIELWKETIFAAFPDDDGYKAIATDICSGGKIVARYRHALIHGHWLPPERAGEGYRIRLGEPIDKLPAGAIMAVPSEMPKAVHQHLRQMTDKFWEFKLNRTLHGHRKSPPKGGGQPP